MLYNNTLSTGTLFCITILCKKLHVQDCIIGGMAGISRIAGCLVLGLASTRLWFYSAPLFNILSPTGLTAVRSLASKVVDVEEIGKLFSLIYVYLLILYIIYFVASRCIQREPESLVLRHSVPFKTLPLPTFV